MILATAIILAFGTAEDLSSGAATNLVKLPTLLAWQPPPPPPLPSRAPRGPHPPPPRAARPAPPPPPPLPLKNPEARLPRTDFYAFFAPGGESTSSNTSATFQAGVGIEEVLRHGIGIGLEGSALGRSRDFGRSVTGLLSPNAFYHLLGGRRRGFDPFVTGGYTAFIRNDIRNGLNVGAGTNYWFRPHTAVRLEVRDTIEPSRSGLPINGTKTSPYHAAQYWGVRIGLVF